MTSRIPPEIAILLEKHYDNIRDTVWQDFIQQGDANYDDMERMESYWRQPCSLQSHTPEGIVALMQQAGWTEMTRSVRFIFKKRRSVAKLAVDGGGLMQNYLEGIAYQEVVDQIRDRQIGTIRIKVPALREWHTKSYWVIQELVDGRTAHKSEVSDQIRQFLTSLGMSDIEAKNFKLQDDVLWLLDLGYYRKQVAP